jgi:peptidoglycan-associated lipoprotein
MADVGSGQKMNGDEKTGVKDENLAVSDRNFQGWNENTEMFAAYTVHFDYDSSIVKENEKSKLDAIASQMKGNPSSALKVEGFCDERGTEEYNRSLGERRALALREQLASLGVEASRMETISYGDGKPVALGHDEAAWSQNRRGEFVQLTPPK